MEVLFRMTTHTDLFRDIEDCSHRITNVSMPIMGGIKYSHDSGENPDDRPFWNRYDEIEVGMSEWTDMGTLQVKINNWLEEVHKNHE